MVIILCGCERQGPSFVVSACLPSHHPTFFCPFSAWMLHCLPLNSVVLTHSPVLTQLSQSEQETTPRHKQEVLISALTPSAFSCMFHCCLHLLFWPAVTILTCLYSFGVFFKLTALECWYKGDRLPMWFFHQIWKDFATHLALCLHCNDSSEQFTAVLPFNALVIVEYYGRWVLGEFKRNNYSPKVNFKQSYKWNGSEKDRV